jgi:hypothetical protein
LSHRLLEKPRRHCAIMLQIAQDRPTWHDQTLVERRICNAAAAR